MRLAGIHFAATEDLDRNIDRALEYAQRGAEQSAEMLVFHQLFHTQWFLHEENQANFDHAIMRGSDAVVALRDAAREFGLAMVCPIFEKKSNGTYANTCLVIDSNGMIIADYEKTHLTDFEGYREQFYFTPGNSLPVFRYGGLTYGIALCWDNFFPEVHRAMALKGVDVILAPSAAGKQSNDRWMVTLSAQAIVNGCYILRVNRTGQEAGLHFYGETFCANPVGELLYEATGEVSAVYTIDVDAEMVKEAREIFPHLDNRRPELYNSLMKTDAGDALAAINGGLDFVAGRNGR